MDARICEAIKTRTVLIFEYDGVERVVHPYCHGLSRKGRETLRAVQIDGTSRRGGFGFGKLWTIDEMRNVRNTERPFVPDDPNYNPVDSAMVEIHCFVERSS